jgi:dephospho-CoA kinase
VLRIGLTGGIGSGKSTVAGLFARRAVPVIDTDALARELVRPGEPAHAEIVRAFGARIVDASGEIDRPRLRRLVFADAAERRKLEAILHPRIRKQVLQRLAALHAPYCIVVVPLLIEAGFTDLVDRILVVDCDERQQIARAVARGGLDEAEVRRVIGAQLPRAERLKHAHDVLNNDAGLDQLEREVARLDARYRALVSEGR